MNQWPPGQASALPGHLNPAQMYGNGNAPFDLSQFTQGLQQQQQQNGGSGTATPSGFPNHPFTPGSVIPAKRPHDGMSGSPVQTQQASRSQTPSFPGAFPGQQAPQQQQQFPNPYAHLQQSGSNNATPSPTMQNQQFRQAPQQQQPSRMQNASPSPFPQQQQQQPNYGSHMSPTPQPSNQPTSMPQQGQMGNSNPQYAMNNNMAMAGMGGAMQGQMNNNTNNLRNVQQVYQQRLIQQQQSLRNSGIQRAMGGNQNAMMPNAGQARSNAQMANGQGSAQMTANAVQMQQAKRASFLNTIRQHCTSAGKHFDEHPTIAGRPVDYLNLWTVTTQFGGSQNVDRIGSWQMVANKLGFPQNQYPTAAEELKQLHVNAIAQYERMWYMAKQHQNKQEQARMHAHQMAGVGPPDQASPTKMMPGVNQQNQFAQFQQGQQPPPQATPVQANAQLPQNGMSTPQQQMLQHRRSSSLRKTEQMTPQAVEQSVATQSPQSAMRPGTRGSPGNDSGPVNMVNAVPQSSNYTPATRISGADGTHGGLEFPAVTMLGDAISRLRPDMPSLQEMGVVETKAIALSLASGIHAEVRYALDMLVTLSNDMQVTFNLEQCEDLIDVIVDCAEEQVEQLSDEAAEVSDALDLPPYEDVLRASKIESDTLQEVHTLGTLAYDLDRAADRVIAITTIFRNFSFYEHNHRLLTQSSVLKWLSNTIRLLGTRNMLLRTSYNTQDFYKDMIIFLSNVTQSLELPSRDDALHILHFLLAFAPQPAPSYADTRGKVSFASFHPSIHRYLPPAVDCLAKLLARQDPNRMFYKSIFTASSSSLATSESPLDLLTRAFALSISVLPNRAVRAPGHDIIRRTVEARKAYLTQGMLAADILTTLMPPHETALARAWIESEDGWATALLNLAAILSVDKTVTQGPNKPREFGLDTETFKLIAHRALGMLKRLAERAGKSGAGREGVANGGGVVHADGDGGGRVADGAVRGVGERGEEGEEDEHPLATQKWDGIPHDHLIVGACLEPGTDRTALRLLCGLLELSERQSLPSEQRQRN